MVVINHGRLFRMLLAAVLVLNAASLSARGRSEEPAGAPSEPPQIGAYTVPLLFVFSYSSERVDAVAVDTVRSSAAAAFAARRPSVRLLIDEGAQGQVRSRAIERGAIGWVELSVQEDPAAARITVRGYAVTAAAPVFELSYREPPGLSGPRLRRAWGPAADEFDGMYEELVTAALADVRFTSLTLRAVPGTSIHGLTETPQQVPDSGILQLSLPAPSLYTLEARAPLHYPVEQMLLVAEDDLEVALDQQSRSAYSWDLGLSNASYPSLEGSRRIAGDYAFIRGGLTTYLVGAAPLADDDDRPTDEEDKILFSEDMTVFNLQLGSYLHPPYNRLRAYVAAGALWRLIHTRGYWGGDPVAAWGVLSTLGVENRPSQRWRVFLEWRPSLYQTEHPEILMRQLPGAVHLHGTSRSADEEFLVTDDTARAWILSGGSFRLGVRWQP